MKKRFITGCCFILFCSASLWAALGGGNGTADDPYLIYTKAHLLDPLIVNGTYESLHFKLMADIDFEGQHCPTLFSQWGLYGVFDGNHKRIKNITMVDQEGFMGGGLSENAVLKNLTLQNPVLMVTDGYIRIGLLTGWDNWGTIDNCHVIDGEIHGSLYDNVDSGIGITTAAGITYRNNGSITNSSFSGTITAAEAAGLVISNEWIIEDSSASVDILSSSWAGGAVGFNYGLIRNCSTSGRVANLGSEWNYTGGLVATNRGLWANSDDVFDAAVYGDGGGIILDSYSTCDVIANGHGAGGLVGNSWSGAIRNCYASGSVTGHAYVGGLIGTIQNYVGFKYPGIIRGSYSTGDVFGDNRLGGLAGENGSSVIRNSYSTGSVSGVDIVGGLVGCVYFYPDAGGGHGLAIVDRCYSTGRVTGARESGGLIGRHWNGTQVVTRSFWDTQTSGWSRSAGGTGRTTAQMKTQATFAGAEWNFQDFWYMADYPVFVWDISPLQAQIDAAQNGDVITVDPGVYEGRLYFKGKNITLTSTEPTDAAVVAATILKGKGIGSVVTFAGSENETCVLSGFTITGGYSISRGGGIDGSESHVNIRHCQIHNNIAHQCPGGGIWGVHGVIEHCTIKDNRARVGSGIAKSDGIIRNCLIYNNQAEYWGHGLNNCDGEIINCTIAAQAGLAPEASSLISNCDGLFRNCIFSWDGVALENSTAQVVYCCGSGRVGEGNIQTDPLFVNPLGGDFRLLPDSPCIDAGDPASDYSNEPWPNGGRINMGAYGNTPKAARSRDGLIPLGFDIVRKTRIGRTLFEYEIALIVHNPNTFDMSEIQMKLIALAEAVESVSVEELELDRIQSGHTRTSQETFVLTIDRSKLIPTGRLTWEMTYYLPTYDAQIEGDLISILIDTLVTTPGDINGDGRVDLLDLAILASQWQGPPDTPSADIAFPQDGFVGIEDFLFLVEHWLD